MDMNRFYNAEFMEHAQTMIETYQLLQNDFMKMVDLCVEAIENGNKIMFFGNGGSAADSQHLATELAVRYKNDRSAIASMALTTDTSALTATGNDFGFDFLFSRQIEAVGKKGDIAIGISTSGNSANVIKAFEKCRDMGITTIGFGGETGGNMVDLCDVILKVPSKTTARIQEMHITLGQMLCGAVEQRLGLVDVSYADTGMEGVTLEDILRQAA